MAFVGRNELEFFLCYRCQVFKIAVKGKEGVLEVLLGGGGRRFFSRFREPEEK